MDYYIQPSKFTSTSGSHCYKILKMYVKLLFLCMWNSLPTEILCKSSYHFKLCLSATIIYHSYIAKMITNCIANSCTNVSSLPPVATYSWWHAVSLHQPIDQRAHIHIYMNSPACFQSIFELTKLRYSVPCF